MRPIFRESCVPANTRITSTFFRATQEKVTMAVVLRLRVAALASVLLGSCATSSHVLVGTPRPPISPDLVKVYTQPPEKYEQIATLNANSSGSMALTTQQNMDKAI